MKTVMFLSIEQLFTVKGAKFFNISATKNIETYFFKMTAAAETLVTLAIHSIAIHFIMHQQKE